MAESTPAPPAAGASSNPPAAPTEAATSALGKSMAGELVQIRSMGKIGRVSADTGSDLSIKLSGDLTDPSAPTVEHIAYDDVVRAG
jgi:hypothetical protein